jgi:hypothetical protein
MPRAFNTLKEKTMNVPKIKTEKMLLFIGGATVWLALAYMLITIAVDLCGRLAEWLLHVR